jgi:hypothetical protein
MMTTDSTREMGPKRLVQALLILFIVGICSRGHGIYTQTLKTSPETWTKVLEGSADAPEQYRTGVVMMADWMTRHIGFLSLPSAFTLLDFVAAVGAVLLLYSLLGRGRVYREASATGQWFGSAAFVALTIYLLDWTNWYQKVETLAAAGLVAVMLWFWTRREIGLTRQASVSVSFLVVTAVLSFVRADVALMVCLGFAAGAVLRRDPEVALQRSTAIVVSLMGAALAAGIQFYLMKVRYPATSYGDTHAFMLAHDWKKLPQWVRLGVFVAPFLWTLAQVVRLREFGRGANGALLLGATGYAVLWMCMGRLEEVRIFLPVALGIVPLTVELAMMRYGPGMGAVPEIALKH